MRRFSGLLALACAVGLSSCEGCGDPEPSVNSEIRWANDVTVFETADINAVTLTITLGQVNTEQVTVDYATVEGTATPGEDFVAASGTVTFDPQ